MAARSTILVVDDEADVVASVKDLLRLEYHVRGATSVSEALPILQSEPIDVVLTDQRMPGTTGVEFLRRVRQTHPEVTRLLFTGYADIKAVIDAINQGNVFRYITKPWEPDELLTIVRQAVEQHALLAERKRLLADLQAKNRELEEANQVLRQASERKSAFIKVASHELRTPLTILIGLTDLASRLPDVSEPLRDWIRGSARASARLQQLVNQLIQMLAAERFQRALERTPTAVADLLRGAADDVRPFVEQRRQSLHVDAPSNLGTLNIEAGKIRDSLDHLLLNAIKFTPDGGTIHLIGRRLDDGGLEIEIRDAGQGIDPAALPYIFEPFFTSYDVSRHASGQFEFNRRGLGLGLSLVKAFVEMHGGTVTAASEPGQGARFIIQLPPM